MLSCIGDLTNKKQEALLFLTVSVLTINVVNIVILEVGEWHFFMTSNIQEIIGQKNLKKLVFYGIVYLYSILQQVYFFAQRSTEFEMNAEYGNCRVRPSVIIFISDIIGWISINFIIGNCTKIYYKIIFSFRGRHADGIERTV